MRVLVAEDNTDFLNLLAQVLELHGHVVLKALDGVTAYKILQGHQVDVIISDLNMPGMSGFELRGKVRGNKLIDRTPFICLSAHPALRAATPIEDPAIDFVISKMTPVREVIKLVDAVNIGHFPPLSVN
jgi:CheY-like chemotaxis protein